MSYILENKQVRTDNLEEQNAEILLELMLKEIKLIDLETKLNHLTEEINKLKGDSKL